MQDPRVTPPRDEADKSVGEMVSDVSELTSTLVREEIELAKAEVREKVEQLIRGSVLGIVAGVFALAALMLIMHGVAWLLNDLVFDNFWLGFFVEAGLFLLIGAIAVLIARRAFKKGAPPTPDLAIEEAKLTRERLERGQ
ncbi:MAG: phage holin family protein [Solirubrobacterales bacterium]